MTSSSDKYAEEDDTDHSRSEMEEDEDSDDASEQSNESKPAWKDDDEDDKDGTGGLSVDILHSAPRLRHLRRSREETKSLGGAEFERRLRQRFSSSTGGAARADWAKLDDKQKEQNDEEDDGSDDDDENDVFKSTTGPIFATSRQKLPQGKLTMVRCLDANITDPNASVVQSARFMPNSDPDRPLLLTAGLDKTLRFFQVGNENSTKVHGIHFPDFPIYTASFLGDTGNVILSSRRKHYFMYDAAAGKVERVARIAGRNERSWEKHSVSHGGKTIAFLAMDGNVVLVDAHTRHWMADLKINGSVRAVGFSADDTQLCASGSDGEIYRFDLRKNRCIERFSNNDGTITSAIEMNDKYMAVGSESGMVNLYADRKQSVIKSIPNLVTAADSLRFNHDGQILAMASKWSAHGLKMLHVPSRTVFANWPTSKTPLGKVQSVDFSPESKFLAVGNEKGKCLLYQISHYQ